MIDRSVRGFQVTVLLVLALFSGIQARSQAPKSQEISERDGIPVLLKHLPEWERVRPQAVFVTSPDALKKAAGERQLLDLIDFASGTEAVTAPYPAGRLVIVEFTTPQASVEADKLIQQAAEGTSNVVYRRIGNYNAFVFDASDPAAANALLDEIKYEKQVQWLFGEPRRPTKAERDFTTGAASLFLSTFLAILIGIAGAMCLGAVVGLLYFRYREKERAGMPSFSDAGGMVRLNLDGLTPEGRLLNE